MNDRSTAPQARTLCRPCLADRALEDRFCRECGAGPNDVVTISPSGESPGAIAPAREAFSRDLLATRRSFERLSLQAPGMPPVARRGPAPVLIAIGLAVLSVAAVVGIALSIINFQRARTWETRSSDWESRANTAEQRSSELTTQLTDSRNESAIRQIALEASEEDRQELQLRIDGLANEKASAQDQQRLAEGERDYAVYVSGLASGAAIDARQCLDDVNTALSAIVDFLSPSYIDSLIDRAVASCAASDQSYATFVGSL